MRAASQSSQATRFVNLALRRDRRGARPRTPPHPRGPALEQSPHERAAHDDAVGLLARLRRLLGGGHTDADEDGLVGDRLQPLGDDRRARRERVALTGDTQHPTPYTQPCDRSQMSARRSSGVVGAARRIVSTPACGDRSPVAELVDRQVGQDGAGDAVGHERAREALVAGTEDDVVRGHHRERHARVDEPRARPRRRRASRPARAPGASPPGSRGRPSRGRRTGCRSRSHRRRPRPRRGPRRPSRDRGRPSRRAPGACGPRRGGPAASTRSSPGHPVTSTRAGP